MALTGICQIPGRSIKCLSAGMCARIFIVSLCETCILRCMFLTYSSLSLKPVLELKSYARPQGHIEECSTLQRELIYSLLTIERSQFGGQLASIETTYPN